MPPSKPLLSNTKIRYRIEPFERKRKVSVFDCGFDTLNSYLRTLALKSSRIGYSKTYLAVELESERILGYYAIASGEVAAINHPQVGHLMPKSIPAIRLGRLAVAIDCQSTGIGSSLLMHAMERTVTVAEQVACAYWRFIRCVPKPKISIKNMDLIPSWMMTGICFWKSILLRNCFTLAFSPPGRLRICIIFRTILFICHLFRPGSFRARPLNGTSSPTRHHGATGAAFAVACSAFAGI